MPARTAHLACLCGVVGLLLAGCAGLPAPSAGNVLAPPPKPIDPQQVQGSTTAFAQRYMIAMADVYDRVQDAPAHPRARELALQNKLLAGHGAMGNAVNPSPIVGLMDMAIMVALTRNVMEDPWAQGEFGADNAALIVEALKAQETDIWTVVGTYLNPSQILELRDLIQRWRKEHPDQHYVGGARLTNFPEAKDADKPGFSLTSGIFGLVRLDPFTGLDPAVRQVEESRILAERMFFYLQNMPTLLSWQTDILYSRVLSQPSIVQLLKDTSAFSANTGDFTHATVNFADASARFAQTIETFRAQLPEQQATLVKQVDSMIATQREGALKQADADITALRDGTVQQLNTLVAGQTDAALKQASAEIAAQRDAAIKQLDATVTAQRDAALQQLDATVTAQQALLTRNLQGTLNGSMDLAYQRLRSLILLAAGALLAVLVLYRLAARLLPRKNG